jgi:hypothetical protein
MTITDFKNWLKTKVDCPNWCTGGLRGTGEESIVIYNGMAYINPTAVGGYSSYRGKGIRVLVHWNKNVEDSEIKAMEVYDALYGLTNVMIEGKPEILPDRVLAPYSRDKETVIPDVREVPTYTRVIQINMRDPEPVYLGVDDSGVFEYVIDFEMIIER